MSRQKTAGIHAGRPQGLEKKSNGCCFSRLALPRRMHAFNISRPGGRRTGCAPFSDRAKDGESENPRPVSDRCCALSRRHFFGDFLCASKESYPPVRAEAFASCKAEATSMDYSLRSPLRDQPSAVLRASRLSRLRGNDGAGHAATACPALIARRRRRP